MIPEINKKMRVLFLCLAGFFLLASVGYAFDKAASGALAHYVMGAYYDDVGDIERAIQEYRKALKADSGNLDIRLSLAYLKKNDFPKAIEELNAAVLLDADAPEPHAVLALIYTAQNNAPLAQKEYEIALKNAAILQPKNVEIYKGLGIIYLQQKKYNEAQSAYKFALDLDPDDSEAHFYLGSILDELKDRKKAILEFRKAIKLRPDYHEALNYLGYTYVEEGRNLREAEKLIRRALESEPDNGAYVDSLGWLYFKRGKFNEALKELKRASALIEDPVVYDHLGDAYLKVKDFTNARINWEKSLKLDPDQEKVKEKLNYPDKNARPKI